MRKLFFYAVAVVSVAVAALTAMTGCSSARTSSVPTGAEIARQEFIAQMLEERMYKVDFTMAYPRAGRSLPLNYPYFVSVIGNRVESFLPYFGRVYTVPYGGGEGLHFEAPITDYTVDHGRKGQWQIRFDAETAEDSYTFDLEVYPSGESYLSINSIRKQGMSFSGEIDLDPEFEAILVR